MTSSEALASWDSRIAAAYVERRQADSGPSLTACPLTLQPACASRLDATLRDLALRSAEIDSAAVGAGGPELTRLRDAGIEVTIGSYVRGLRAKRTRADADADLPGALGVDLAVGLVHRISPSLRERLVELDVHLPPPVLADLDAELHDVLDREVDAGELERWEGDPLGDLRSVLVESGAAMWMRMRVQEMGLKLAPGRRGRGRHADGDARLPPINRRRR